MAKRKAGAVLFSAVVLVLFVESRAEYTVLGELELSRIVGRSDQSKTQSASDACTDLNNQGDAIPPDFCALGLDGQPCITCLDGSPFTKIDGMGSPRSLRSSSVRTRQGRTGLASRGPALRLVPTHAPVKFDLMPCNDQPALRVDGGPGRRPGTPQSTTSSTFATPPLDGPRTSASQEA